MEMNEFEEIEGIREAWKQEIDPSVIKAATEDWDEYPPHVQAVIEAEAKNRGLWEKVLYLRGEKPEFPTSSEGNLEGYVCEGCKGNYLNFDTGRCGKCDLPVEDFGYCKTCDKFFCIPPGRLCPDDGTKLIKRKTAMALLRIGNLIFDNWLMYPFAFLVVFLVAFSLAFLGFTEPEFYDDLGPIAEFFLGFILCFLYYFIFESIWQRTPAKFITGTKVVTCDGTKPTPGTIMKRTLIRFVPFEAFSFLGERVYGWHDRWSGTYVIKAKRFEKKTIDHNQVVTCPQPSSVVKTPEKTVDILSVSHRKVEVCENCGRTIGKLEQAYVFKNHIVCQQCHEKLKKQI
jgi:uncharacterized RDD family membrane protein YckC